VENNLSQTKLIEILKVFSNAELRQFRMFIESGLSSTSNKALILFDFLSAYHPTFTNSQLSRERAYMSLYPGSNFEDKKLRYAMTDLFQRACEYLAHRTIRDNQHIQNRLVKEELARRGADKSYLSLLGSDGSNWETAAPGNADTYFDRYETAFTHLNHFFPRQKRSGTNPIAYVALNLDRFYITRKLQLLCEIVNVRNVMSVNYEFHLQDEIVKLIVKGEFSDVPAINIYFRILMTLTEPENEFHFVELEKLLLLHASVFKKDELRDLYQYLMNYCIKKINLGNTAYLNKLLDIYREILPKQIIFSGVHLSQWDFKNIVTIGLRCGEYDWVYKFIEDYKQHLATAERANAYRYNLANYHFNNRDYKKALNLISQVEFTDLYYQLDSRAIVLKCYFEMDDEEALFYHIAAFKLFLSRNKQISEYQRTTYKNMIRFTSKLARISGKTEKLIELQKQIEEVKQIADINWIRKKAKP